MPDLITHGSVGLLLGMAVAGRCRAPLLPLFVAGNLLPDVLSRLPGILMGELNNRFPHVPALLLYGWEPFHQPFGAGLASLALALLLPPAQRLRAFALLWSGMLLHLLLDLTQFHEGAGCMLLFPLDTRPFELGWVSSEACVYVALPLALLAVLASLARRRVLAASAPSPRTSG